MAAQRTLLLGAVILAAAPPRADSGGTPSNERKKAASVFEKLLSSKKQPAPPSAGAGAEAAAFESCESCVGAGYGWSKRKDLCGNYANRDCPAASATEPMPPDQPAGDPAAGTIESGDVMPSMDGGLAAVMNFAFKTMNFAFKTMNFGFKTMEFALQMMDFVFKMMICRCWSDHRMSLRGGCCTRTTSAVSALRSGDAPRTISHGAPLPPPGCHTTTTTCCRAAHRPPRYAVSSAAASVPTDRPGGSTSRCGRKSDEFCIQNDEF